MAAAIGIGVDVKQPAGTMIVDDPLRTVVHGTGVVSNNIDNFCFLFWD